MSAPPDRFGPYIDLKPLKGGGFGQVYTGRHAVLGRIDAIKMLAPGLVQSDEDTERFTREASAMALLNHPHIVRVHTADVELGFPYIAMEYVEGDDLGDYIRARGPLPIAEAVRLGRELGSALAHMHAQGIIHRDLKSSNVLRREADGRYFLADFGIALQENLPRISKATLGSQEYISPEQIAGHTDARSDVYSLGVVLFEALTGHVPFEQGDGPKHQALGDLLNRIHDEPAALASSLRAGVPGWLDETIAACLAKAPEARPQSAASVVAALRTETPTKRMSGPIPPLAPRPAPRPQPVRQPTRRISGPMPVRPQPGRPPVQPGYPQHSGPVHPYPPQAYQQPQQSNTLLWVIALLAALVIIAAGLYIANTLLLPPRQSQTELVEPDDAVLPTRSERASGEIADVMEEDREDVIEDEGFDVIGDSEIIDEPGDPADVIGDGVVMDEPASPRVNAQQVAQMYLSRQGQNDVSGLLGMYANRVDYYGNSNASPSDISEDKRYYFDRWPTRSYRLAGPIQTTARADGSTRIRFDYTFTVRGDAGERDGRAWTELDLVSSGGEVVIAAERGGTR